MSEAETHSYLPPSPLPTWWPIIVATITILVGGGGSYAGVTVALSQNSRDIQAIKDEMRMSNQRTSDRIDALSANVNRLIGQQESRGNSSAQPRQ